MNLKYYLTLNCSPAWNFMGLVLSETWNFLVPETLWGWCFLRYKTLLGWCIRNTETFLALKLLDFIVFGFFHFLKQIKETSKKITKGSKGSAVNIDSLLRNVAKTGLFTRLFLKKLKNCSELSKMWSLLMKKSYLKQFRSNYEQYISFYTELHHNNKIYIYITELPPNRLPRITP